MLQYTTAENPHENNAFCVIYSTIYIFTIGAVDLRIVVAQERDKDNVGILASSKCGAYVRNFLYDPAMVSVSLE